MPFLAKKACPVAACPNRQPCPIHGKKKDLRGSAHKRGYDNTWQRLRKQYLAKYPLAECKRCPVKDCIDRGRTVAANTVHHIIPISKRPNLRLVWSNLMSVSRTCHERIEKRNK